MRETNLHGRSFAILQSKSHYILYIEMSVSTRIILVFSLANLFGGTGIEVPVLLLLALLLGFPVFLGLLQL
jgi:hypothetical protein